MTDEAFVQAIEDFKAAKMSPAVIGLDLCSVYAKVKPILIGILPFLKLIPNFGKIVADALTALMAALDKACPS